MLTAKRLRFMPQRGQKTPSGGFHDLSLGDISIIANDSYLSTIENIPPSTQITRNKYSLEPKPQPLSNNFSVPRRRIGIKDRIVSCLKLTEQANKQMLCCVQMPHSARLSSELASLDFKLCDKPLQPSIIKQLYQQDDQNQLPTISSTEIQGLQPFKKIQFFLNTTNNSIEPESNKSTIQNVSTNNSEQSHITLNQTSLRAIQEIYDSNDVSNTVFSVKKQPLTLIVNSNIYTDEDVKRQGKRKIHLRKSSEVVKNKSTHKSPLHQKEQCICQTGCEQNDSKQIILQPTCLNFADVQIQTCLSPVKQTTDSTQTQPNHNSSNFNIVFLPDLQYKLSIKKQSQHQNVQIQTQNTPNKQIQHSINPKSCSLQIYFGESISVVPDQFPSNKSIKQPNRYLTINESSKVVIEGDGASQKIIKDKQRQCRALRSHIQDLQLQIRSHLNSNQILQKKLDALIRNQKIDIEISQQSLQNQKLTCVQKTETLMQKLQLAQKQSKQRQQFIIDYIMGKCKGATAQMMLTQLKNCFKNDIQH